MIEMARYFGLYDAAPVGHITVSNHGLILHANRTATAMFGMPPDELVTQPITRFIRTDDHDRYRQLATIALATGDPQSGELWIVRSDGTSVWAHVAITTATAPDSDVPACRVVLHDITERQQGKAEQRDTEARYRRLVETAEEGIWIIDQESRTDFVNPKMARMLGYTVEEMIARPFHDFMDPAGRAITDNNVKRRQQGIAEQHEFKFLRRDGTDLWASLVSNPITSATGEYLGALAMITDVTARKHAERALRESEEKFRTLFENAGDAIFIMDGERFVDCNVRALEMFGCQSRPQFVELPPYAFSPPRQPNGRDSVAWAVETITAALAGQSQFFEWVHTRLDGTPFPAEVTLNAVTLRKTVLLQGIVRDITERQQAQVNREQLEQRMQETQKLESLGVLAGGIAHDFNNLLTSIIGHASLASMEAEPDSALHDYLESITVGSQRAADLCKQMLAYSGRGRFVVRRINLNQLVTETAQMLKLSISKKPERHHQSHHRACAPRVSSP